MSNEDTGLRSRLTDYGDPDFSLFFRKAFIKAMGYSDDALDRPIVGRSPTPTPPTTPATATCPTSSMR
ncbi:MAG: hypothetical protein WDM84_05935 [Bauldia sp.]